MRSRRLKPLPAALLGLTLAVEIAAVALSWGLESSYDTLLYAVYSVCLVGAGALIASRHPRNAIGWLFCVFGLISGWGWILTFLLFPDGRLPARRWRLVLWIGTLGLVLAVPGWSLSPDRGEDFASGRNPLAVDAVLTDALLAVGVTLFLGAFVASVASLVLRFRRARGDERQQLKWFAFAAAVAGVILPLSVALWYVTPAVRVLAA